MSEPSKRVLDVGNCGPDHGTIVRMLSGSFDVEVVRAHGTEDAMEHVRRSPFDLVLINRLYDADGRPGMELLRQIKADPGSRDLPVMIISNRDDAQSDAVAAGAVPGFGKRALGDEATIELLKPYLA